MSGSSDESDSTNRPVADQKSGQPTTEVTMTLGKCLAMLVAFELVLGVVVFGLASLVGAKIQHAMVAWSVCAVGTIGSHLFSWYPKGNEFLLARLAGSSACRTLPALGFAIWGLKYCEPRISTSIGLILMFVYMSGLLADLYVNLLRSKDAEVEAQA